MRASTPKILGTLLLSSLLSSPHGGVGGQDQSGAGSGGGRVLREYRWGEVADPEGQHWRLQVVLAHERPPRVTLSPSREGWEGVEDEEDRAWYFVGPGEFLGDWSDAYGGAVEAELMHRNFLAGGAPEFIGDAADVIIRSSTHELQYFSAVKPLSYQSSPRIRLHEDAGWRVSALGGSSLEGSGSMQDVLKDVSAVLIRGGFYVGAEITILHSFTLFAAAASAGSTPSSTVLGRGALAPGVGQAKTGRWVPAKDPVSGRTYYWHSITKQSRWTLPKEDADDVGRGGHAVAKEQMPVGARQQDQRGGEVVSKVLESMSHRAVAQGEVVGAAGEGRRTSLHVPFHHGEATGASEAQSGVHTAKHAHEVDHAAGGLTEKERGNVLSHAAGEEMVQARISLRQSTLAITRTHLLLVDRHCILRSDVRSVESLSLSSAGVPVGDGTGGAAETAEGAGFTIGGMLRQRLDGDSIASSGKACRQFEQLLARNAQALRDGRPAPVGGPPRQQPGALKGGEREGPLVRKMAELVDGGNAVMHLCFSPDLASVHTRAVVKHVPAALAKAGVGRDEAASRHPADLDGRGGSESGGRAAQGRVEEGLGQREGQNKAQSRQDAPPGRGTGSAGSSSDLGPLDKGGRGQWASARQVAADGATKPAEVQGSNWQHGGRGRLEEAEGEEEQQVDQEPEQEQDFKPNWDDWGDTGGSSMRVKATTGPADPEPDVRRATRTAAPPAPAPPPARPPQRHTDSRLQQHHQHHLQQRDGNPHGQHEQGGGGGDALVRLLQTIGGGVRGQVGGVREAMAYTDSEIFHSGPLGTRREPLSAVGPLMGSPSGGMQLTLQGREAIQVSVADFSDRHLHEFFEKLEKAARPLRASPLPTEHSDPPPLGGSALGGSMGPPRNSHHAQPTSPHDSGALGGTRAHPGDERGPGGGSEGRDTRHEMNEAVIGGQVLERVDGQGCSVALTGQEIIVVDARGMRREVLQQVVGVRNAASGDLEIEIAGGAPIRLDMLACSSGNPAALSQLFGALTSLTAKRGGIGGGQGGGAGAGGEHLDPSHGDVRRRVGVGVQKPENVVAVVVSAEEEAGYRIKNEEAAQLQTQLDSKLQVLGVPATASLVGSVNALAMTELQLVVLGNVTGNHADGRVLMLARVRKMLRDEQGVHHIRMLEGFTFRVPPHGFAVTSDKCIEMLDNFMQGVSARVHGLKVPEQLEREAEEDEIEAAAEAKARHAELKEQERLKQLADMKRREAARKAMHQGAGKGGGGGHTGPLPQVSDRAQNLLRAAAAVVTAQIVAVLESGDAGCLFALTVAEVVCCRTGEHTRREALSDIDKVVSSPEGNLMLKLKGFSREPLPIEAAKFNMEELGHFFQFLSEFHGKAVEAEMREREREEKEKARLAHEAEQALIKQGEAAVLAAKQAVIDAKAKLRATIEGAGPERRNIITEVYGEKCIFGVSDDEALFADPSGLQVAKIAQVASVRTDPTSGALQLVIRDTDGEQRAGITVPADAFSMEQLGAVFGAMSSFTESLQRAARDQQAALEEERLAKERAIREAEEEARRLEEEAEAARKAEQERLEAEAKAKAEAEAKAFKENMLNMPKVAAKKAKDPILLQLAKDDLVLAVSRLTLYAVNAKAEMKTTSIKKIEKVSMGSGGNSMMVIVDGEPFVEITVSDFPMDELGAFFQKLQ